MNNCLSLFEKRTPFAGPRVVVKDAQAVYHDPAARVVPGSVDESAMMATFVVSTMATDRTGDIVVPQGCLKTLDNYRANPRIFWNHQQEPGLPIASCRNLDGSLGLTIIPNDRIVGVAKFHGKTLMSEQVFALVAAGELEAASIGFMPLIAEKMTARSRPSLPGYDGWPSEGYYITEFDFLEFSVVGVGMNQEAVASRMAKGICGKPLAPAIRQELEPYAAPRKAWSNGATLVRTPAFVKVVAGLTTELRRR